MEISSQLSPYDTYPVPPMPETAGRTETFIGNWLKKSGQRDKIILATKVIGRSDDLSYLRADHQLCLNRLNIESALEDSLKRLQTDYIDLYQVHWPDRKTNYFGQLGYRYPEPNSPDNKIAEEIAIEETLSTLNELVQSGKIRHIGISNETPWGAMRYLAIAKHMGMARIVSIQNPYNLLNRSFEVGLAEITHRESVGLLAYSPLAFGVLSGKYCQGLRPTDARLTLYERFNRYTSEIAQQCTQQYVDIAHKHNLDPAQMALAYVNSRPFVTSNIIGATSITQLQDNIASDELLLSTEILDEIEAIHQQQPNPCP